MLAALLIGATGIAADARAQDAMGRIRGNVRSLDGGPIAQAQVFISGAGGGTLTDSDGDFTIDRLPAGNYLIQAHRIGFAPARQSVELLKGETLSVDFVLEATPLALPGIEVTAHGAGRDPLAVLRATAQLAGGELQRELGGTIASTMKSQPGISERSMGPAASMPVIRGLTGDRILILRDGQRIGDLAGSADDHGVTIDPLSVDRIEVIRGPATLLYGNNALGGVVNVISSDLLTSGSDGLGLQIAGQAETAHPGLALSVMAAAPMGSSLAVKVDAGAREAGDMRIPRDPALGTRLANTRSRSWNGSAGIAYRNGAASANASVGLYDFEYGLPMPPGADPVGLSGGRREGSARVELSLPASLFRSLRIDGSVQDYAHDEIDQAADEVTQSFALTTRAVNVLARQGSIGGITEGAWGFSALFKRYAATGPAALTPPAESRGLGMFAFQEIGFARGALELGGRYDDYRIASADHPSFGQGQERRFPAFSGSIGIRIAIAEGLSGGVSVSRSFRAPTVEELFSGAPHAGTGAVEFGNPALHAERGTSVEAILRARNARWNGQLAAYTSAISNFVHLAAVGDTVLDGVRYPVLTYAQDLARLSGLEGSVEWAMTPDLVIGAMGDYIHAERKDGTPLSYMAPPRVGTSARWEGTRVQLGVDLRREFRQDRVGAADELPTPAHTLVRLHGGTSFRVGLQEHSIALRVENLTNALHREATSRIKDFAPGPGRNVAITYRVRY